jgi:hypothetical protein
MRSAAPSSCRPCGSSPHERDVSELNFARSSAHGGAIRIDPVMVALALGIVLWAS